MSMASTIRNAPAGDDAFMAWFKCNGGTIHPAVGLTSFPSMGRGAMALMDIKKGTILFTVPRSLTLSMRTSSLPPKFGLHAWKTHQLHKGWAGLILCMLWEAETGDDGKWSGYFKSLPDSFQTPMFWSELDLQELQGTTISADKIGKTKAERAYHENIVPAIKSRPDLFPPASLEAHYSLHKYHIMGSLILSRSFQVELWEEPNEGDNCGYSTVRAPRGRGIIEVDEVISEQIDENIEGEGIYAESGGSDEEDEDSVDPMDVSMVPMADMLNARYKSENAKLCYESKDLQMMATRDIFAGQQIWNTYGDPPNSDLLRRYGHIDILPMPDGVQGNPADIVEIRADLVMDVLREPSTDNLDVSFTTRINWWLEEGGDDIFILETTFTLPDDLISLIHLLTLPTPEWESTQRKGKIPKPIAGAQVFSVAASVLQRRLNSYNTTIAEDEILLTSVLSNRKYMAVLVRLGEKRILKGALDALREMLAVTGNKRGICKREDTSYVDEARYAKKSRK